MSQQWARSMAHDLMFMNSKQAKRVRMSTPAVVYIYRRIEQQLVMLYLSMTVQRAYNFVVSRSNSLTTNESTWISLELVPRGAHSIVFVPASMSHTFRASLSMKIPNRPCVERGIFYALLGVSWCFPVFFPMAWPSEPKWLTSSHLQASGATSGQPSRTRKWNALNVSL